MLVGQPEDSTAKARTDADVIEETEITMGFPRIDLGISLYNNRADELPPTWGVVETMSVETPILVRDRQLREDTLDDLIARLGVPGSRILARYAPGTATEADVIRLVESSQRRVCELVDGILIEKPMGYRESILAAELVIMLASWIKPRKLGLLSTPDGPIRIVAGRIRFPDTSFIAWSSLPGGRFPKGKILAVAPDLTVEILSESNTTAEMESKLHDYFSLGVKLVWIADPDNRTVTAYTAVDQCVKYGPTDFVPGEPVLPGFQLSIAEWFSVLDHNNQTDFEQPN